MSAGNGCVGIRNIGLIIGLTIPPELSLPRNGKSPGGHSLPELRNSIQVIEPVDQRDCERLDASWLFI